MLVLHSHGLEIRLPVSEVSHGRERVSQHGGGRTMYKPTNQERSMTHQLRHGIACSNSAFQGHASLGRHTQRNHDI